MPFHVQRQTGGPRYGGELALARAGREAYPTETTNAGAYACVDSRRTPRPLRSVRAASARRETAAPCRRPRTRAGMAPACVTPCEAGGTLPPDCPATDDTTLRPRGSAPGGSAG